MSNLQLKKWVQLYEQKRMYYRIEKHTSQKTNICATLVLKCTALRPLQDFLQHSSLALPCSSGQNHPQGYKGPSGRITSLKSSANLPFLSCWNVYQTPQTKFIGPRCSAAAPCHDAPTHMLYHGFKALGFRNPWFFFQSSPARVITKSFAKGCKHGRD